ncbi:MAG: cytidyltransferase, partial [Bacteroidales bacterium]|nr:cytidyltransferase [Bacteroidales bacterium]
ITLGPRIGDFDVLSDTFINQLNAKNLADAANKCWVAIKNKDLYLFGTAFRESFEAQIAMFPHMVNPDIMEIIETYKNDALGWKLSGAGGGGYLVLVSEKPVENASQIRIVRP